VLQEKPRISHAADKDFLPGFDSCCERSVKRIPRRKQTHDEANDDQNHPRIVLSSPRFRRSARLVFFLRNGGGDALPGAGLHILRGEPASFAEWLETSGVHHSRIADGSLFICLGSLLDRLQNKNMP
jgi:hypothetical protein